VHPRCILAQAARHAWIRFHIARRFSAKDFQATLVTRDFMEEIDMPHVHITWLEGRTPEQKRKVIEGIMKVLVEEAGAKPEKTQISIVDVPATNFAVAGVLASDPKRTP
jgi:4-oxalocrotonate tautomerase